MTRIAPDAGWLGALAGRIDAPPLAPRAPLLWQGEAIGSVEHDFASKLAGHAPLIADGPCWRVEGGLTESLAAIAAAMRERGLAHAWRDEQLGVRAADGRLLGTIERACVRPLGVATHAVHLLGLAPDGRHWVQQRSFGKANDPGLWDTLMGGMVPASETLEEALEREAWEEAGLRASQWTHLQHGGRVQMRRPAGMPHGYVVEWVDWFACIVPDGITPENQDGEVQQFRLIEATEATAMLHQGEFTLEAAAVFAAHASG